MERQRQRQPQQPPARAAEAAETAEASDLHPGPPAVGPVERAPSRPADEAEAAAAAQRVVEGQRGARPRHLRPGTVFMKIRRLFIKAVLTRRATGVSFLAKNEIREL